MTEVSGHWGLKQQCKSITSGVRQRQRPVAVECWIPYNRRVLPTPGGAPSDCAHRFLFDETYPPTILHRLSLPVLPTAASMTNNRGSYVQTCAFQCSASTRNHTIEPTMRDEIPDRPQPKSILKHLYFVLLHKNPPLC